MEIISSCPDSRMGTKKVSRPKKVSCFIFILEKKSHKMTLIGKDSLCHYGITLLPEKGRNY